MKPIRLMSAAAQVAAHLRGEALRGGLGAQLPGIHQLAADLGVNHKTVAAAIRMLENERLLVSQGMGRPRRIERAARMGRSVLQVGILAGEAADRGLSYMVELRHELEEAGHSVFFAPKYLFDPGMNAARVSRMVERNPADAWLVVAGSREVLEWFIGSGIPVFALFGRRRDLPVAGAGPDKIPALQEATRALVGHGHRRIVLLARGMRRLPEPGAGERAFLAELARNGISTGAYHLPDWEESIKGFHGRLESHFGRTPPTALIVQEAPFFVAAQQFLARHGLKVPDDVSLVCTDANPVFSWCDPVVSHIRWDSRPVVRRIVRWAANVSCGRKDLGQLGAPAVFVPGGTIGPAKERN